MGFKTDTSFLRFLTMGALGVRQTIKQLKNAGFQPIELERYCGSNKIWMTKVKRLRLPDLLCVRTGTRFEVRAKSDLKIRMSDAPANPDRTWDAGNRNEDIVALIAMHADGDGWRASERAVFFDFRSLRKSVDASKLGPPKSASEGAERDRVWPAIVPSRSGTVRAVDSARIAVEMHGDGKPARNQTYALKGRHPYVKVGDKFVAEEMFLGGAPKAQAQLPNYLMQSYQPLADLTAKLAVDRYAAAKAIPHRTDLKNKALPGLEAMLTKENDERVALEAAGSAAVLGSAMGQERIEAVLWGDGSPEMRMEAVLILTELKSTFARAELAKVAAAEKFDGDEIRQAAVWGLGKAGLKAYDKLLGFVADTDDNVAMHAIMAFGSDTPADVINKLVANLDGPDTRLAAASSEALRAIGNPAAVDALITPSNHIDWIVATLGRMPPMLVQARLQGHPLLSKVQPILLLNEQNNWLGSESRLLDLAFLSKQDVEAA
jgi:hypothetical protein